jgi:hypothetical protein
MRDMATSRAGPLGDLKPLSGLQREGDDGVALDGRQNARRRHWDGGWRRRYQDTGGGHGTRHLCDSHLASDLSKRECCLSQEANAECKVGHPIHVLGNT